MKIIKLKLFRKFLIITTLVVLIFGFVNILFLWNSVYKSFENEIDKRCVVLSKIISEKILTPMVYGDILNMYNILDDIKESDNNIAYIFIIDASGKIVAQTYDFNIPKDLILANNLVNGKQNIEEIKTENYKYKIIRDIAYPILEGEIGGIIRLGLAEKDIRNDLKQATVTLSIMIAVFLFFGLLGALFFSYLITSPIKLIIQKAENIDFKSIKDEDYQINYHKNKKLFNLYFQDELDILTLKFSEMIFRLKKSISELQETRDSLIQAEKLASIGTLTSGIGHEINNPISGIKNCINRIDKNPENIKQNIKYFNLIKEATEKIENVVKHLLDFSRKQEFILKKTNPTEIVENAITLASHKLKKNNISIKRDYSGDFAVKASSNHLEQVLLNLILNAADAIIEHKNLKPELNAEITINMYRSDNKVYIIIKDNGIGIRPEDKTKLFDPFFSTKEFGKGTGLGLYISFNIIKEHKGKIRVKSDYLYGSEFTLELQCFK